ncbi:MAG TPA: phenylalanine--tRNA ligase subunit beta [Solirubrobacteraceae bacterium]|jgi:phenylalanyl-tRNA synthetase beta chain
MRVLLPWLREYCDPDLDVNQIEERLTMTGTKVEAIHRYGVPSADGFVVGKVLEAELHPDADRLKVCKVDLGSANGSDSADLATIVCGAPNVAAGQTVAVALPGATMPDGTKLKKAKLRGVASEGMILAEQELQIGPGGEGILVLDEAAGLRDGELVPGTPLQDVLPIAIEVLELEITPNRPDCLGVFGVARELHAATGAPLQRAPWSEDPGSDGPVSGVEVRVQCPDLCPRFTARVFEDVTIAPSPLWLKARLMAAGMRPINNVVDITNYAMLLTGQPLHAFDLDRVAGGRLTVRRANDGERVQTLDGQTRELDSEMVVIDDEQGPTSIAGLMGGARSEVQPNTERVLLEVATWSGPNIHRSSWQLGLRSEASARFEKGLQPEQCMHAQVVASRLLLELCGARLAPGTIDEGWTGAPPQRIRLREAKVRAILGVSIARARQTEILAALDFQSADAEDTAEPQRSGLDVAVPAVRRGDVTREVDLIEEVARIDGVDRLPATLPARRGAAGMLTHAQRVRRAAEDALVGRGLHEIVGWSFTDPGLLDRLRLPPDHPLRRVVTIENPLSEAQSTMRPTLLGSLLDAARHNVARNGPDVAIFESGAVYRASQDGRLADEHHGLGALLSGALTPRSWRGESGEVDFFAAKALLGAVLDKLHVDWSLRACTWPFLHPGRSAAVHAGAEMLGFLGEVHPLVASAWDLPHSGTPSGAHPGGHRQAGGRTAAFAIDLGKVAAASPQVIAFQSFAAVPSLRRDLAVTLPESVSAEDVLARVRDAGAKTLEDASVFDVYTGEQVGEGRRSLALSLSFRATEKTLTDEDIAPARERIVAALAELGGELRG